MAGVKVGSAVLEIFPSAKGFGAKLNAEMGGEMPKVGRDAGDKIGAGIKSRMGGVAKAIAVPLAGAFAAAGVKDFLSESIAGARESQKIGAQTEQVIKSTGKAAKLSADQVGDLATAISNKTGYDDEAIQSGQNLLLTFTNIKNEAGKGNDVFSQTTTLMTDMSVALGQDTKASAIQLGKALNDPVKGVTALSKVGVSFTAQQKEQIKALVKSGDTMGAQKVILKELNKEFGGSAAAQSTATDKLKTSMGNLSEQIGGMLLPYVDKLASWMNSKALPAISGFLQQMQDGTGKGGEFAAFLKDVGDKAVNFGSYVMTNVVPAIRQFVAEFKSGEDAGGAFKATLQKVSDVVAKIVGFLVDHPGIVSAFVAGFAGLAGVKKSVDGVSSAFSSVKSKVDTAKAGWDAGKTAISGLKSAASSTSTALSGLKAGLSGAKPPNATAWTAAGNSIRNAGAAAKGYAASAMSASRAALASAASSARAGAAAALAAAKQGILTAATKVMTVAQRALNLVMRMNPIGIVITALIALGAGLVLAYKKSETFRNIVNAVWRVVKSAIKGTVDWFLKTAWPTMRNVLTWIGDKMNAAKVVIQRAWDAIKDKFQSVVNWVKGAFKKSWDGIKTVLSKPVEWGKQLIDRQITGMRRIFTAIRDFMKGAFKRSWDGLKKIFTAPIELAKSSISGILGKDDKSGLRGVFSNALEAIKKIWEKLKDIVAKPINGVIGIINRPFIKGFNDLGKPFGLTLPEIPTIKGYAAGGEISGPWRGPRADNVLGVSSSGMPVARVNPGEFITQVSSTRSMERKHPGALSYINRYGTLPGHASGGFAGMPHANTGAPHTARGRYESYRPSVSIVALGNFLRSKGFAVGEHPRFGGVAPVHMGTSLHYAGQALDINADGMAGGEDRNLSALAKALVSEGWGTIWHSAGHYDHLHVDTGIFSKIGNKLTRITKTNALTDAIGSVVNFFTSKLSGVKKAAYGLIDGATAKFGGGDFTKKILGGVAKKAIDGALSWGDNKSEVIDTSGTEGSTRSASAWIPQIKQALALNGLPASDANVQKWVRQIQSESGGNPNAIQQVRDINWPHNRARGLVQVIPPTFRQYHVPGTSNNIFDPIANLAAGINYAKKTYGVGMGAIGRGHGYAGGGLVERQIPVFDNGGTLAPGINVVNNKLGKPEPLVRPEQYGRGAPIFNIHGAPNDTAVDLAREVTWEMRRRETAGKYKGA